MKAMPRFLALLAALAHAVTPAAHAEIAPAELVAPKLVISGGNLNFTVQPSLTGRNYQLQYSDTMAGGTWLDVGMARSGDGTNLVIFTPYVAGITRRFYRLLLTEVITPPAPDGFALIPAGSYIMGDQSSPLVGDNEELPAHSVYVSAFYMAKYEVGKALWDDVATWAATNGYDINAAGTSGKGTNHPAYYVTWYECLKWCNARSRKENLTPCYTVSGVEYKTGSSTPVCNWSANGYRLPTEAEWEKAARGGLSAQNFPWGDTISHSQANYYSNSFYSYDVSPTRGSHPTYHTGASPYTSPVGSFAPNGYDLYDMAGNLWEWCWDWYGSYTADSQTDPRGATSGSYRVYRGGAWGGNASDCRVAYRHNSDPGYGGSSIVGFRPARSSGP